MERVPNEALGDNWYEVVGELKYHSGLNGPEDKKKSIRNATEIICKRTGVQAKCIDANDDRWLAMLFFDPRKNRVVGIMTLVPDHSEVNMFIYGQDPIHITKREEDRSVYVTVRRDKRVLEALREALTSVRRMEKLKRPDLGIYSTTADSSKYPS